MNFDVVNCLVNCGLVDQSIWGERYEINSAAVSTVVSDAVVLEDTEELLGVIIAEDFFLPLEALDDTTAASSRGRFFDDAAESTFFFFGAKNEVIMMLDWWMGYSVRRCWIAGLFVIVSSQFSILEPFIRLQV